MEVSLVRLLFWKQESLACLFQNIITAKDDRIYMSNFSKLLKVPRIRQDLSFSKACSHLKHKWHRYVCTRMHVYACVCVCVCVKCVGVATQIMAGHVWKSDNLWVLVLAFLLCFRRVLCHSRGRLSALWASEDSSFILLPPSCRDCWDYRPLCSASGSYMDSRAL